MPLGERIVTPVHLGRTPIPIDHGDKRNVHQAMASNALVGILHQLASVVRLADDIFCDISEECQKVFEKSERISRKIGFIEQFVKDLDAKTVTIRKFQQHICAIFKRDSQVLKVSKVEEEVIFFALQSTHGLRVGGGIFCNCRLNLD